MTPARLQRSITTDTPVETLQLGAALGRLLQPGCFLAIDGPLGAGKTVFVRGILQGMGVASFEGSPTFVLMQPYTPPDGTEVLHVDAYRLGEHATEEWLQLGWFEWLAGDSIILVEWAELVEEIQPTERLSVLIEPHGASVPVQEGKQDESASYRSEAGQIGIADVRGGEGAEEESDRADELAAKRTFLFRAYGERYVQILQQLLAR